MRFHGKIRLALISFIALISLFFATGPSLADPVAEDRAERAAVNWMLQRTGVEYVVTETVARPKAVLGSRQASVEDGWHYRFNLAPDGWVIVAGDDVAFPIIAYSQTGTLNPDGVEPPGFNAWMNNADATIRSSTRAETSPLSAHRALSEDETQAKWAIIDAWYLLDRYETGTLDTEKNSDLVETQAVAPLLKTQWNQWQYYNALCPIDNRAPYGYDGRVPAGCGALALAQVMRYYAHPQRGAGSHSYSSAYGTLSANFGATTYDWNAMPPSLSSHNTEVAKIIYHSGIALEMNYGPGGSSASTGRFGQALRMHFGYQSEDMTRKDGQFSDAQWEQKIQAELNARAPVIYRGNNAGNTDAHYLVLDGSDTAGLYHFNWGWGGKYDGFYKLTGLTAGPYDYSQGHWALFGVRAGTATKPATPALVSPTGAITDSTPTYRWTGASSATRYRLFVRQGTDTVVDQTFTASAAGCAGGNNCAIRPSRTLSNGSYQWWVAAGNDAGWSAWSTSKAFSLGGTAAKPPTPVLVSPMGPITDSTPTYRWTGASFATRYRLFVRQGTTTVVDQTFTASAAGCAGGTNCAIRPSRTLSNGSYQWWVAAGNSAGWSSWSSSRTFSVGASSRAGWGALNDVYCLDRSPLTFRVTIEGVNRYSTTRGPGTATWQGWVYTNQGYKTVGIAIYGGCTNTITGTLQNVPIGSGKRTLFVLGYDDAAKRFVIRTRTFADASAQAEAGLDHLEQGRALTLSDDAEYSLDIETSGTSGIGVVDSLELLRALESATP